MKFKIIFCGISTAILMLFSASIVALPFAFDNYSETPALSYRYSFDGKEWITVGELSPQGFVVHNFNDVVPPFWKIEVPANGKKLQCVDYKTKQPVVDNKISLTDPSYQTRDDLLLDVLGFNANHEIVAQIIDVDGEGTYSNTLACTIQ